ncbi:MAG: nucleoside kinase [Oscillibacter sp.]|jgi:uridine kinase|nr:nucleoside kinase [Oscillibacter sp.]
MSYSLEQINEAIRSDPAGFAQRADAEYQKKVDRAAEKIADHRAESHIVLLSGPSGSGKTTTAMKIEEALDHMGIVTHTVSMDNYFMSIDPETAPRNRDGGIDYESPFCLDIELLNRHFAMLDRGETIHVPKFEFARQMRSAVNFRPLRLGADELAIFEGIHALNDVITGKNPRAFKLYIAARSNVADESGGVVFEHAWVRLCRRIVRDAKFRGSDAAFTLKLWPGVCRGEKLYISPYRDSADLLFDTAVPYELSVYKSHVVPLLEEIPAAARPEIVEQMLRGFDRIAGLDDRYVAPNSLIREFIGGSTYSY